MPRFRGQKYPKFPKISIQNLTESPLFLAFSTRIGNGIWLAENGQSGDTATLVGVDLSDKRVQKMFRELLLSNKISITVLQTLEQSLLTSDYPGEFD